MKVIRHAGVDSSMIILDDQAGQQMTLHFQLSLQHHVLPITGFVSHTTVCLRKPELAVLYREVSNSEVICTQLYLVGTADNVLIREVSFIVMLHCNHTHMSI